MKTKVKLSELHLDDNLLFIRKVQPKVVSKYRENYRNGADFPPLIVEKGTNRIISGHQRYTAMLGEFGKDYMASVIFKEYDSEKDALIDFANENLKHGEPFTSYEKKLLVQELKKNSTTEEEISRLFNISCKKIQEYESGLVTVIIGDSKENEMLHLPAKNGFEPPRPITEEEYKTHKQYDTGMPLGQKVNELLRWLDRGFILPTEKNVYYVNMLEKSCTKWLAKVAVEV